MDAARRIATDETKDVPRRIDSNRARQNEEPQPQIHAQAPRDLFKSTATDGKVVKMSDFPQDTHMMPARTADIPASELSDGPSGPRVKVTVPRDFPTPKADAEGNLIFTADDPRFDCTQTYVTVNKALKVAENYLGRTLPWGFTEKLEREQILVHPHAGGNMANAFYSSDAGSLNFFSFTDPKTGETHRTGQSADVVAHEAGHAILDAIRHSYIGSLAIAGGGYHESFGDMTAMLTALHEDTVITKLREETNGDLTKPNVAARTAEMLGLTISHIANRKESDALRNAINNFKYADQHFIPYYDKANPNSAMGQESHAYSNLFTGAFYDLFVGLYNEQAKDAGRSFKTSVENARDTAGRLLFRGTEFATVGDPSYREIALAFIKADAVDNGGRHRALIEKTFKDRKILTAEDIAQFDRAEKALPTLTLDPEAAKSEENAKAFVNKNRETLGVPAGLDLEFLGSVSNKRGETFLQFGFHKDIDLWGAEFKTLEGSRMRTNGGLVLAFDRDNKLIAKNFDDITAREVEDIKDHLNVVIGAGGISMTGPQGAHNHDVMDEHGGQFLHLTHTPGPRGPVLQRSSVIWG